MALSARWILALLGLLAWSQWGAWKFFFRPGMDTDKATDPLVLMLVALLAVLLALGRLLQGKALEGMAGSKSLALGILALVLAPAWAGMQFSRFGPLLLFSAGLFAVVLAFQDRKPAELKAEGPWPWLGATALGALLVVLGAAWFRQAFLDPSDSGNISWMFPPRATTVSEPIRGGAFTEWARLWAPALCLGLLLGGIAAGWGAFLKRPLWALSFLWLMSLAARFAVVHLSPQGLGLLWLKGSTIHSSFLHVVLGSDGGAWAFLKGFNALQKAGSLPVHAGTHGPLPELFYFATTGVFGRNPAGSVLAYMALQASLVFPVYLSARKMGATAGASLGAAALAAFTPQALILGNAGFDAMLLTLLAWCFWFFLKALGGEGRRWILAAAFAFWLAQLYSMVALVWPVFFGLYAWLEGRRQKKLGRALKAYAAWLALPLALHWLLWTLTGGSFGFLESCRQNFARYAYDEAFFHKSPPRYHWAWGNLLVYAAWASLPLCAAWGLRVWAALKQGGGRAFDWLGLGMLAMLFLTVLSTREVNRYHIWASFFLFLPAAEQLGLGEKKKGPGLLMLALALMMANAVVLEILVFDQY